MNFDVIIETDTVPETTVFAAGDAVNITERQQSESEQDEQDSTEEKQQNVIETGKSSEDFIKETEQGSVIVNNENPSLNYHQSIILSDERPDDEDRQGNHRGRGFQQAGPAQCLANWPD